MNASIIKRTFAITAVLIATLFGTMALTANEAGAYYQRDRVIWRNPGQNTWSTGFPTSNWRRNTQVNTADVKYYQTTRFRAVYCSWC